MAIHQCKMCGGKILADSTTYGTCDSCGNIVTLPKVADDQILNLFNRANNLRRQNEFDKAIQSYENILNIDASSAEAYWGMVLSRFGIEYVEDPATGKRIPTCHRVQSESILADADYLAALDNAENEYTRSLYEEEVAKISEIQKGILEISSKEEPYDVFICYKETTDGGSRTKDSVLAQDIYYQLVKEGYKVFFSRITLEGKLGQQYEPYIFSALNSAKVMLVVGTKPEHFNSLWVKNEWSRFLTIAKKDRSRLLIPCYRDMDAYDLPDEMTMLQSQDMSKIGFLQDLTHGIKKVMESQKEKSVAKTNIEIVPNTSLERLIQNSETYLKLDNHTDAQEVFTRVTKEYPEDYRGWWGLIICKTKGLSVLSDDYDSLKIWLKYVKKLADLETYKSIEEEYVKYLRIAAESDANKDILLMNGIINDINEKTNKLKQQLYETEQRKKRCKTDFKDKCQQRDSDIETAKLALKECEKKQKVHQRIIKAGAITIIVGVCAFIYGTSQLSAFFIFIGVLCAIIGINLLYINSSRLSVLQSTNNAKSKLENVSIAKKNDEKQYNKDIKNIDKRIESINSKILDSEKQIDNLVKYINVGNEKISEIFISNDIHRVFDNTAENLRKKALEHNTGDCMDAVDEIVTNLEVGNIYDGVVTRIREDLGVFVEFANGKEGLIHISELDKYRIERFEDVYTEGDHIKVKITEIKNDGKIRLTDQELDDIGDEIIDYN